MIVVDDAADDITARIIDELPDRGMASSSRANTAAAPPAPQPGARAANGDWVLFCDDDILAPPSHLLQHLATHQHYDGAAVAGNWELAPELVTELWRTPFGRYRMEVERRFLTETRGDPLAGDHHLLQMPLVAAADLSLRRELFWQIGGFDEEFPLAGAEDQDLSLRARAAGAVLLLDTTIHCFHYDHYLSLDAYCEREERNARTMSFMVRKHPSGFGDVPYARENRPIEASESPKLVVKKLLKALLASEPMLEVLHRITRACEEVRAPEQVLRRLYYVAARAPPLPRLSSLVENLNPELSIAIVLHNSVEALPACLRSVHAAVEDGWAELIAVDNASPDDSGAVVQGEFPRARIVKLESNRGFAAGANVAMAYARGRYWLLLNPDVRVPDDGLERLVEWMDSHPRLAVASPELVGRDGEWQSPGRATPSIRRALLELTRAHRALSLDLRGRVLRGPVLDRG